jgi:hypothetical protein
VDVSVDVSVNVSVDVSVNVSMNVSVNPKSLHLSGIECWCIILQPFTSVIVVFCSLLELSAAWYCSAVKRCYIVSYFVFSGCRWFRCWPLWFICEQEPAKLYSTKTTVKSALKVRVIPSCSCSRTYNIVSSKPVMIWFSWCLEAICVVCVIYIVILQYKIVDCKHVVVVFCTKISLLKV